MSTSSDASPIPTPVRGLGRARWLVASNGLDAGARSAESLALDVLAVLTLGVGAAQMGVLLTLSGMGFLVLGVPIGILVDRHLSPRLLTACGVAKAALLGTLVTAWALDALTFLHLAVVMTLTGVLTVLSETTQATLVPRVVTAPLVPRLAARLESADAALGLIVPAGAGVAVAALGAGPVLGVASAFLLAAGLVALKVHMHPAASPARGHDDAPSGEPERAGEAPGEPAAVVVLSRWGRFWGDAGEGWRVLRRTPVLWLLTLGSMAGNIGMSLFAPVEAVWVLAELGLGPQFVGLQLTAGAAGALVASLVADRAITLLGERGCLVTGTAGAAVAVALHVAAYLDPAHAWGWLLAGSALWGLMIILGNITQAALFARACPAGTLGRVTAMRRTLTRGTVPIATLAGGVLGAGLGVGAVVWAWQVCALLSLGFVLLAVRQLPGRAGAAEG